MSTLFYSPEQLNLPDNIANKLRGKKLELLETEEGILLRPIMGNPIKELRGFLKGNTFTTEKLLEQKTEEKELE